MTKQMKQVTNVLQIGDVIATRNKMGSYGYKILAGKLILETGTELRVVTEVQETQLHTPDGDPYILSSYRLYNIRHGILSDRYAGESELDGNVEVVGILSKVVFDKMLRTKGSVPIDKVLRLEQPAIYNKQLATRIWETHKYLSDEIESGAVQQDTLTTTMNMLLK